MLKTNPVPSSGCRKGGNVRSILCNLEVLGEAGAPIAARTPHNFTRAWIMGGWTLLRKLHLLRSCSRKWKPITLPLARVSGFFKAFQPIPVFRPLAAIRADGTNQRSHYWAPWSWCNGLPLVRLWSRGRRETTRRSFLPTLSGA